MHHWGQTTPDRPEWIGRLQEARRSQKLRSHHQPPRVASLLLQPGHPKQDQEDHLFRFPLTLPVLLLAAVAEWPEGLQAHQSGQSAANAHSHGDQAQVHHPPKVVPATCQSARGTQVESAETRQPHHPPAVDSHPPKSPLYYHQHHQWYGKRLHLFCRF